MTDIDDRISIAQDRLALLRARLKARTGRHEYRDNIPALKAEIGRLEGSIKALKEIGE